MRNIDQSPHSFTMAKEEVQSIFQTIKAAGEELTGIFHSHPTAQPYPSPEDIAFARYPDAAYCILSLAFQPELRCYHIQDGHVSELNITKIK